MRLHRICSWHVNSISPISVFIKAHHCCSLVNESLAHQHDSIPNEEPRTQVALDKWAHFWHHGGEYDDHAGCVWGFETDVHLINMISMMESIQDISGSKMYPWWLYAIHTGHCVIQTTVRTNNWLTPSFYLILLLIISVETCYVVLW